MTNITTHKRRTNEIYYDMFGDYIDNSVLEELVNLTLEELYDIAENNDAECSYSDFSAGQIDCAIASLESLNAN
jgi:hypothetical protein